MSQTDEALSGDALSTGGGLAPIRENEEAVRQFGESERDDDLDAAARVLLALANEEEPDHDDLETLGMPTGGDDGAN